MNVIDHSLLLDAVMSRCSVTLISVHLHIENTTFSSNKTEADIVQWDYGSWPDGLPKKDGANALSGAGSLDTATTRLSKTSRTKNLIIEWTVLTFVHDTATVILCGIRRMILNVSRVASWAL